MKINQITIFLPLDVRFTELLKHDSGFLAYLERNLSMPTDLANGFVNATFNGSQVIIGQILIINLFFSKNEILSFTVYELPRYPKKITENNRR